MSLDMNDPQQYGLAMDRLAAGVGPTLGPQATTKKRRQARVEELQRQRRAETAEETTMRQNRVAALDRLRQSSRKKDAKQAPTRLATALSAPPAPTRLATALSAPPAASPPPAQKDYGCLLDYACFEREADWSEASSEDEFDPNGILPYCPRYNISSGRAKEMYIQSMRRVVEVAQAELAVKRAMRQREQAKRQMAAVAAQILQVGAWKKALERAEIGPAPLGFQFLQIGEDIYLARSERDPSMVYVAPALSVYIRTI
ncbi:hypothetical protein B0H11DRAFT_2228598 [Mycena galericulata]|nr:hypothetical protein B0H11DRAFT_2228598 [Mycena galericulata]